MPLIFRFEPCDLAPCQKDGCRGFLGHFPPPLLIRVFYLIVLHIIRQYYTSQPGIDQKSR